MLAALEVAAADAWFVGDRLDWVVAAPQAEGMTGVWIDHGARGVPADSAVRPYRDIRDLTA